jgi:hypothetical protein
MSNRAAKYLVDSVIQFQLIFPFTVCHRLPVNVTKSLLCNCNACYVISSHSTKKPTVSILEL